VAALLKTGAATLNGCNSKRSGIHLCVFWTGTLYWCGPQ
jgi:hypothetical protein